MRRTINQINMPQSFDTLRVGHTYKMINYGEETCFVLVSIQHREDYIVMDLNSREKFNLKKLVEYGTGRDYDLFELEE